LSHHEDGALGIVPLEEVRMHRRRRPVLAFALLGSLLAALGAPCFSLRDLRTAGPSGGDGRLVHG